MENGKVPFHEPWKMDFPGAHSRATSVCHVMFEDDVAGGTRNRVSSGTKIT